MQPKDLAIVEGDISAGISLEGPSLMLSFGNSSSVLTSLQTERHKHVKLPLSAISFHYTLDNH